jgi:hypothetical protein
MQRMPIVIEMGTAQVDVQLSQLRHEQRFGNGVPDGEAYAGIREVDV